MTIKLIKNLMIFTVFLVSITMTAQAQSHDKLEQAANDQLQHVTDELLAKMNFDLDQKVFERLGHDPELFSTTDETAISSVATEEEKNERS